MPTNNLNVTLNNSYTPPRLDVDDHGGGNQVTQASAPTTITWHLTGNIAQGHFVPMDDPSLEPGFSWMGDGPPAGYFDPPQIGANGNSLSICDKHLSASTNGAWIYKLRVRLGNETYTTLATALTGSVNNPVIINR